MLNTELKNNGKKIEVCIEPNAMFTQHESGHPEITVAEENDNIVGANPTEAYIKIEHMPCGKSRISTGNNGNIPSADKIDEMNNIGLKHSSGNGIGLCGQGQLIGTLSGRSKFNGMSSLDVTSCRDNVQYGFTLSVNGNTQEITYQFKTAQEVDELDYISKIYNGICEISDKDIEILKLKTLLRSLPYLTKNPKFKFEFNGEMLKAIDIMYNNDKRAKREFVRKEIMLPGSDKPYLFEAEIVFFGEIPTKERDILSKTYGDSADSSGVILWYGDYTSPCCCGHSSWKIINNNHHTLKNQIRVLIKLPENEWLKKQVFIQSPNKSTVRTNLSNIKSKDGVNILKEFVDEINEVVSNFSREREECNKRDFQQLIEENNDFVKAVMVIENYISTLPVEFQKILQGRKLNTIMDCAKRMSDKNKKLRNVI
jgi:hypothetical protein